MSKYDTTLGLPDGTYEKHLGLTLEQVMTLLQNSRPVVFVVKPTDAPARAKRRKHA